MSVVSRVSDVRSRTARYALMASIVGLVMLAAAPAMSAAGEITLTTPFPAVAVAPGSAPSFDISVTTSAPGRVGLSVGNVPTGWTAVLRGGGFTIDGVESDGKTATKVTLNVTVPTDATEGRHASSSAGRSPARRRPCRSTSGSPRTRPVTSA